MHDAVFNWKYFCAHLFVWFWEVSATINVFYYLLEGRGYLEIEICLELFASLREEYLKNIFSFLREATIFEQMSWYFFILFSSIQITKIVNVRVPC